MTGIIQRIDPNFVYIDLGKIEAKLAKSEQIPTEEYHVHDRIKVFVTKVENTNKGTQIYIYRSHQGLLKRLFEMVVPVIYDGIVELKSISRVPVVRYSISVYAHEHVIVQIGTYVILSGR